MIKVGAKVECIDDDFFSGVEDRGIDARIKLFQHLPSKGRTYTVREIHDFGGVTGLVFDEIRNKPLPHMGTMEPSFNIKRFRELDDEHSRQAERKEESVLL